MMIAWQAFYDYFVLSGGQAKRYVLVLFVLALIVPRLSAFRAISVKLFHAKTKTLLFCILTVGLVVRLGWIAWSPHRAPSAGTEDLYIIRHAQNLAQGKGYLASARDFSLEHSKEPIPYTADRPIGYALWLSLLFRVFGEQIWIVEVTQVLFGVLSIFLLFWVARQIFNRETALISAALLAIYPTSIFASKIVCEEHLFIPLWLTGISVLISDVQKPSWKKVIMAGLIFGIASHVRTHAFAMGLVAFFIWFLIKRQFRNALLRLILIQFIIFLFALPWAIRNYYRLGEPIMYSTWMGPIFYFSNNDTSDVRYPINPPLEQGGDYDFLTAKNELERNRAGKRAAFRWIRAKPGLFIQKAIGRAIYMVGLSREGWTVKDNFHTIRTGRATPPERLIRQFHKWDNDYYGTIFLLALFGVLLLFTVNGKIEKQRGLWVILITIAYYLAIVGFTLGHRKYRFPLEPFFCMLAAYALFQMFFGGWLNWANFKGVGKDDS